MKEAKWLNNTFPDKDKGSHVFSSKRLAPMLLALLTFLIVVSLSWNIIQQRKATLDLAHIHAKTVLEKDILFRRWNSLLGGVYAPVSKETQPNPYLEGFVSERDLKTPSGRELTLVNPEFMTRQVFELEEKGKGVLGHITSLKPIRPENAADPWEREALLAFEKGTGEISSLEMINGREYMRLMRPLITEEECLKCHERQGYREGDIRGGLSVSVPMEPHWAAFSRSLKALLFWHIFLWFCGAVAIYAGYRLQRRAEEYRKQYENIFSAIAEKISVKTGAEYFDTAVKFIADELGMEYAFIGKLDVISKKIKTFSLYAHGKIVENIEYDLSGTPCENVMGQRFSPYPEKIQELFPEDKLLVQMKAESYAGMPLFSSDGSPLGLISVVSCAPMDERMVNKAKSLLYIFAARASAEIERNLVVETLNREYQFKSAILEGAAEGLCVCHEIPEFPFVRFTVWNNKMNEITGYTIEEINRSGWYQTVYPDPEMQSRAIERMRSMRLGDDMLHEEWEITRSDGTKRIISISTSVITTSYDEHHVLALMVDVTDRKRTEEDLLEASQFNKQIIESAQEGIIVYDKDLKYGVWNPFMEKLTGISAGEVIGKHPLEIFPFLRESGIMANIKKALTGETSEAYRFQFHIPKTGLSGWVSDISAPLRNARGEIIGVIGTVRDITEHMRAEEQLRHSQKMEAIGTLAGGIAHDFNNILNVIIGYSHMVFDRMEADNPSKEQMNEVLTAAERAANLTKKLLAFSRKQLADFMPININETIINFQKMLVRIITENIDLHLDLADKPLIVMADAWQIEQVLMNLATNAKDAMPEGGRLTIGTGIQKVDDEYIYVNGYGTPGMYALITVADTGHGMDAETQNKIFDPFFTTKGIEKGTGLGLAVSYGIIKQHNGYIKVYSEPGQGTLFKIYLPLIEEPVSLDKKTDAPDAVKGGNETILIAEDDASLRSLSRIVLESFGYSVITAENGEDAVRKFMENRDVINLAVLDMIMPKKGGKEVGEVIREKNPRTKILLMSGYTMDIIDNRELTESGFDFIHKPFLPKDLLKKVRETLDKGGDTDG